MELLTLKIYEPRGSHKRLMDVGRYRHNNKGFYKNFTFSKSINKGRTTIIEIPMRAWWKFSHLISSSCGDTFSRGDLIV